MEKLSETHSIEFTETDASYCIVANKYAIVYNRFVDHCFVKDIDTGKIVVNFNRTTITARELLDWMARISKE